jgi:hypothetical protein
MDFNFSDYVYTGDVLRCRWSDREEFFLIRFVSVENNKQILFGSKVFFEQKNVIGVGNEIVQLKDTSFTRLVAIYEGPSPFFIKFPRYFSILGELKIPFNNMILFCHETLSVFYGSIWRDWMFSHLIPKKSTIILSQKLPLQSFCMIFKKNSVKHKWSCLFKDDSFLSSLFCLEKNKNGGKKI